MRALLKRIYLLTLWSLPVIMAIRCAHPVMPEGGPKDVTPPMVVKAEPEIYSTNFSQKKVEVTFNEFIQLKDIQKEVFISPPMDQNPEFKARGKSLVIEFPGELKENTTYSIYFGNSIVDLTESNPKSNFEYVFSTGNEIDSLNITGRVVDAFNLDPVENVLVMIYRDDNDTVPFDSMPLLVRPTSASRTLGDGTFRLGNLRMSNYKIFALEDKNSNFLYDLPNERIAFLDSLVSPVFIPRKPADSVLSDTMVMAEYQEMLKASSQDITLRMFLETDSVQRLMESKVLSDVLMRFIFKNAAPGAKLKILDDEISDAEWCLREDNETHDTLLCWLTKPMPDTVFIEVSDAEEVLDTVRMILRRPDFGRDRKKDNEQEEKTLKVLSNINARKLELNRDLQLTFSRPLISYDSTGFLLIEAEDSLDVSLEFYGKSMRKAKLVHQWKEETRYELILPDSSFTGLRGITNDTIRLEFNTRKLGDYGHLFIGLESAEPGGSYIVRLLTNDEKIVRETTASTGENLEFTYLLPGVYLLKAVIDENRNGTWDPGDYLQGLQPENVFYFPTTLDIRANWEVRETWELP